MPASLPDRPREGVDELLVEVLRLSRQALGVDHASVLLLDAAGRLVPTVSVAREDDQVLWTRFRSMPPLGLDAIPLGQATLTETQVLVIDDASASQVIPENWRAAFDIKSAAIAPLVVDHQLRGALVVDHARVRHAFSADDVRLLEAMAAPLRYLLRVADTVESSLQRHRLLSHVVEAGCELSASRTQHGVLQTGMEAVLGVLDGSSCSVNVVLPDGRVETLSSRGLRQPEPGRHAADALDESMRRAIDALDRSATFPHVLLSTAGATLPWMEHAAWVVLPMTQPGESCRMFMLVGLDDPGTPDAGQVDIASSLCAQTALAYDRVSEVSRLSRRVEYLEALYGLAEDADHVPDMQVVLQHLAPAVRSGIGAELIDAFLCEVSAARFFSTSTPNLQLAALIRSWRRDTEPRPVIVGDLLVVPMLVQSQVVGVLRVRPSEPLDTDGENLVIAVAAGIGGLVSRALLRARIADTERELAVAEERERVGRDLHDTLGQQLFALRFELEGCAGQVTDEAVAARLREAVNTVSRANAELRQAINALSFLEHAKRGLVPSVRALIRKLGESSAIAMELRITGTPARINGGAEEALFRVAHEALANVVRHSRASTAVVTISFAAERVALIVKDDGTGMSIRADEQPGLHFGLRTMQRRMAEVGGGLDVSNLRPHGVRLHGWIPLS